MSHLSEAREALRHKQELSERLRKLKEDAA